MSASRIGILHPGQMGITVAITARNSGNQVFWMSAGRSAATAKRAGEAGLRDAETLAKLCEICPVIVSVCPPEFAEQMADEVAACSYSGLFVDANAISPERARRIGGKLQTGGARFVDGGIIGPATAVRNRTWLYLAGEHALEAAKYFGAGPIEVQVLEGGVGRASALKMCFAAYSKGTIALACAILAAAQELEVFEDLKRQWARSGPSLEDLERQIAGAAPKAWRFTAEMHEIAETFENAGVPPEFHRGAAEMFRRLESFKGSDAASLSAILDQLLKHPEVNLI
jgi:3-hydroxyisobutyrate dehydrogenase-like beta-hydroxyacid dehydrogenase